MKRWEEGIPPSHEQNVNYRLEITLVSNFSQVPAILSEFDETVQLDGEVKWGEVKLSQKLFCQRITEVKWNTAHCLA